MPLILPLALVVSFVPTWMMMWFGSPRFSLLSCCRALSGFGHQSLNVLWPGKSCFSLMNLPFESIKMMTSAFCWALSCSWGPSEASACDVGGTAAGVLDCVECVLLLLLLAGVCEGLCR